MKSHNLIYWRMHDYIGVGPGAHGRFDEKSGRRATIALSDPKAWAAKVRMTGSGILSDEPITSADQATEMMLMGLRLTEGVSLGRYERLAGRPLATKTLDELEKSGLVVRADDRLMVTGAGRPVLNAVLGSLLT